MEDIIAQKTLALGSVLVLEGRTIPKKLKKDLGYSVEITLRLLGNKHYLKYNAGTGGFLSRYFSLEDYRSLFDVIETDDQFFNASAALSCVRSQEQAQHLREEGLAQLVHKTPKYTQKQRWNRYS